MIWPLIWVLTVTVASGVTVPSALRMIAMSPFFAASGTTTIGPLSAKRPARGGAASRGRATQAMAAAAARTTSSHGSRRQRERRTGLGAGGVATLSRIWRSLSCSFISASSWPGIGHRA